MHGAQPESAGECMVTSRQLVMRLVLVTLLVCACVPAAGFSQAAIPRGHNSVSSSKSRLDPAGESEWEANSANPAGHRNTEAPGHDFLERLPSPHRHRYIHSLAPHARKRASITSANRQRQTQQQQQQLSPIAKFSPLSPSSASAASVSMSSRRLLSSLQTSVLMSLFTATAGDSWAINDGWGSGDGTECGVSDGNGGWSNSWYGVVCNANGKVTELLLEANSLGPAALPPDLNELTELTTLNLMFNNFHGNVSQYHITWQRGSCRCGCMWQLLHNNCLAGALNQSWCLFCGLMLHSVSHRFRRPTVCSLKCPLSCFVVIPSVVRFPCRSC
jgi:hypothetical protein